MTDQEARDELARALANIAAGLPLDTPGTFHESYYTEADSLIAAGYRKHPEPKPWEEAKDGEIWVLTSGGVDLPWTRQADQWVSATPGRLFRRNVDPITAGRRIW